LTRHQIGDTFITKSDYLVYTILEVLPFGNLINYRVYISSTEKVEVINDWWLDVYASKVS